MRNHAIRLGYRIVSFWSLITLLGCMLASAARADDGAPASTVLRVPLNDHLTPGNLARLREGSATARDLLLCIERVPDAVITVRAHPLLLKEERLLGRGRFWMVGRRLYALIEYQAEPSGSHRALRVLAHELAHALEVGMLPRGRDLSAIRSQIELRELEEGFDLAPGIETDFARTVSDRVHLEIWGRLPNRSSGLRATASLSHVELPVVPETIDAARR